MLAGLRDITHSVDHLPSRWPRVGGIPPTPRAGVADANEDAGYGDDPGDLRVPAARGRMPFGGLFGRRGQASGGRPPPLALPGPHAGAHPGNRLPPGRGALPAQPARVLRGKGAPASPPGGGVHTGIAARRAAILPSPICAKCAQAGDRQQSEWRWHGNADLWPVLPVGTDIAREREASADDERGAGRRGLVHDL